MDFRVWTLYDVEAASNAATIPAEAQGESLTIQSMSEDADINVMMKRMGIGQPLPVSPRVPEYGDFTGVNDFQSALHAIQDAREKFMEFPPEVRSRFENNPQLMLEFVANDANRPEAEKLGLVKARVEPPQAAQEPPGAAKAPVST